jgi:hypothetical protein
MGRQRLGAHVRILLAVVLAALGMADDHISRARIGQHLGGQVPGERARFLGVAILPADGHPRAHRQGGAEAHQGGGRADRELDLGLRAGL